jgi:hypothetical protein
MVRSRIVVGLFVLVTMISPAAQAQTPPVALDVVGAVDGVGHSTPPRSVQVWLDVFGAVRLAEGLDVVARPVIWRRAFDGEWQEQLYQLGVRYERGRSDPSRVGVRIDVGQMPSPIGVAMLENRADLNPVVSQHSAYYLPLPRVDPEIPRTFLIAGSYPLGAQLTLATDRWDARVAAIDASPVRGRSLLGSNLPPRLLNGVAGFGVTPAVGIRVGVAFAYGPYVATHEVTDKAKGNREAAMIQLEGEWSFGYTRIVGEWIHTAMETARADAKASGGWVEMTQTLHPRLFVAARVDGQHFDYQRPVVEDVLRQDYKRVEAVVGVRVTPDLTLRGGYLGRKGYVVSHWDDQVVGSVVWQRKIY